VDELRCKAKSAPVEPVVATPAVATPAVPVAKPEKPHAELFAQFEKLLDAKLANLSKPVVVPETPVVVVPLSGTETGTQSSAYRTVKAKVKKPKKTYIVEDDSSSSDDEFPPAPPPARRTTYGVNPSRSVPTPENAWYEALFPKRR
jgi:hypothetical protein